MIFTVTALPFVAETHGSQRPNVTAPLVSTAPSDPNGISFMGHNAFRRKTTYEAPDRNTPRRYGSSSVSQYK